MITLDIIKSRCLFLCCSSDSLSGTIMLINMIICRQLEASKKGGIIICVYRSPWRHFFFFVHYFTLRVIVLPSFKANGTDHLVVVVSTQCTFCILFPQKVDKIFKYQLITNDGLVFDRCLQMIVGKNLLFVCFPRRIDDYGQQRLLQGLI